MSDNQLQKTESYNFGLMVIKNEPLLYYSDLRDTDIQKSEILDDLEKQVLLATLNYPKIRTINICRGETGQPNTEHYDVLVDIIGLAIWTMGITENSMPKQEQKLFIPIAIEEIKTFPNLSIEDVRIAFNRGSRRKYGDTFQMSITNINVWLTKYTEETKHGVMQRLPFVKPLQIEASKELSSEEKLKIHNDWLEHVYNNFNEYQKTNIYNYHDFGNKLYAYLKKIGLITLDEQQQEKIWNKAVKELKNEYHPKNGRNFGERIDLKSIYDKLKLDEVDKPQYDLIVIRAKRIAVRHFFIGLIRQAKHIRDVIEDADGAKQPI